MVYCKRKIYGMKIEIEPYYVCDKENKKNRYTIQC